MDAKIFRVNYKSDFILTLTSDAGWMTPFCIKFWTGSPSQAFYASWDGETYTHCSYDPEEPTKLTVQFDDHHLPTGELKYQIAYHFTVDDFPNDTEDEVLNQANVITIIDGEEYHVMLDFSGETAPEIQFLLPAYANELQRIENEQQRIENEQQRIENEQQRIINETSRENVAEEDHRVAVADHEQAESDHTRANNDHTRAESDHTTASNDHTQAGTDHTRAGEDHTRAESDHTTASNDHTQAGTDHTRAGEDHTRAGEDHTRAESDHTRAESDHAAIEPFMDSLGAFDISAYHAEGGVLAKYANLSAALGTNGANIPEAIRKGGMSVKFVLTSDNKYIQARCMAQNFTTDVTQWQGVDDGPVINSKNIPNSGGTYHSVERALALNRNIQKDADYWRECKDDAVVINDYCIDVRTGEKKGPYANMWAYRLLSVFEGDSLKVSAYAGTTQFRLWAIMNISGEIIAKSDDETAVDLKTESITVPEGGATLIVNTRVIYESESNAISIKRKGYVADAGKVYINNDTTSKQELGYLRELSTLGKPVRKVSIIGDSISTFDKTGYKIDGYPMQYPASDVINVNDTYWKKFMDHIGGQIEINASFAGSCVTNVKSSQSYGGIPFPDLCDRVELIGNPDLIIIALGTNDASLNVDLGRSYPWTRDNLDESKFGEAYTKGIQMLIEAYPSAEIVSVILYMSDTYANSIKQICNIYNIKTFDVRGYNAYSGSHPSKAGMISIAENICNRYDGMDNSYVFDVSAAYPQGSPRNDNRYTLAEAIAKVPIYAQNSGLILSFIDKDSQRHIAYINIYSTWTTNVVYWKPLVFGDLAFSNSTLNIDTSANTISTIAGECIFYNHNGRIVKSSATGVLSCNIYADSSENAFIITNGTTIKAVSVTSIIGPDYVIIAIIKCNATADFSQKVFEGVIWAGCNITVNNNVYPASPLAIKGLIDALTTKETNDINKVNQRIDGADNSIAKLYANETDEVYHFETSSNKEVYQIALRKGVTYTFKRNSGATWIRFCNSNNYNDVKYGGNVMYLNTTPQEYTCQDDEHYIGFNGAINLDILITKHSYIGEKVDFVDNKYRRNVVFNLADYPEQIPLKYVAGTQGFDIYEDKYLFHGSDNQGKEILIFDIETKETLGILDIVSTFDGAHFNNIDCGEKYDANDKFPLIYMSESYGQQRCAVLRIADTADSFEVIQTIRYSGNQLDPLPPRTLQIDWAIDIANGFIYGYAVYDGDNDISKILKFQMPSISAGNVVFTDADIIASYTINDCRMNQGCKVFNDKIVAASGLGSSAHPSFIKVIDLFKQKVVTIIDASFAVEPQGIALYKKRLITSSGSEHYSLDFM